MNLAILTQPLLNNYSGLLQNYTLQQVFIQAGHEVETVDRHSPEAGKLRKFLSRVKWTLLPALLPHKYKRSKFNYSLTEKEMATIRRNTNHFIDA